MEAPESSLDLGQTIKFFARFHKLKSAVIEKAWQWRDARSKDPLSWQELGKAEAELVEAINDLETAKDT